MRYFSIALDDERPESAIRAVQIVLQEIALVYGKQDALGDKLIIMEAMRALEPLSARDFNPYLTEIPHDNTRECSFSGGP